MNERSIKPDGKAQADDKPWLMRRTANKNSN
jgi:hypothetical protein